LFLLQIQIIGDKLLMIWWN